MPLKMVKIMLTRYPSMESSFWSRKRSIRSFQRIEWLWSNTNARVKKFQIWADEFRNRLKHYDLATDIVCGLVNFRISGTLLI
jgi:hypothetical protein